MCVAAATQQGQGQPGQPSGDLQSQWAEYYRQLGYAYYGGQPGAAGGGGAQQQQPGASSGGGGGGGGAMPGGSGGPEPKVCIPIINWCTYGMTGNVLDDVGKWYVICVHCCLFPL